MSHTYTLPALIHSYGLTREQWFDPKWVYLDPYQLPYYYRGRRVNLIRDEGAEPTRFEVSSVRGQANRPIKWLDKWEELTVSEKDLTTWLTIYGSPIKRIAAINTFGHGGFDSWVACSSKTGPALLQWHIQNVINQDLAKACPELKEPAVDNGVSWGERVASSLTGLLRLMR